MLKDVEADQDRCGELKQAEALAAGDLQVPCSPSFSLLWEVPHTDWLSQFTVTSTAPLSCQKVPSLKVTSKRCLTVLQRQRSVFHSAPHTPIPRHDRAHIRSVILVFAVVIVGAGDPTKGRMHAHHPLPPISYFLEC